MAMMTWHDAGNNRIEKAAIGSSWMRGHPWAVQG
jgi:hypothetical protein